MMLSGFIAFVLQNRKLKAFAVQPQPIREMELSAGTESLPRFAWMGLAPLLFQGAAALYLRLTWDGLPVNRSPRAVYGPLILGAGMTLWLFGFALATWYGSRRSEPLRRPALAVFILFGWMLGLVMPGMALRSVVNVPVLWLLAPSIATIALSVIYLIKKSRNARGPLDPTPTECWKGGIIYYNPNDPVLFVGRRDGAGFTLNFGNRWSWAVLGSPLLLMAGAFATTLLP